MVDIKDISVTPIESKNFNYFRSGIKQFHYKLTHKKYPSEQADEFAYSGKEPTDPQKRLKSAITKFNTSNDMRLVAETNYFAELYLHDYMLLQEYNAYKNPELSNLTFTPTSADTVVSAYKGKPIKINYKVFEDGSKHYTINFDDNSQINYILFYKSGKMDINGENFEMPEGTILETKSVNGRVFSKLIQTPDMRKNIVSLPEVVKKAEQILCNRPSTSNSANETVKA